MMRKKFERKRREREREREELNGFFLKKKELFIFFEKEKGI